MKKLIMMICIGGLFLSVGCKPKSGPRPGPNHPPGPKGGPLSVEEAFEKFDANGDGKLAETEVEGPLRHDFSQIDLDEDGFISKEELEKAPKPKRPPGPRPRPN